jgi:hypothetical protein
MTEISRRTFSKETLGTLLTYSLLETLCSRDAFADEVKPLAAAWLAEVDQLSRELRGKPLEQVAWQDQVESLFAKVDLADLLKFVDFEKLTANLVYRDRGERSLRPTFPKVEGLPTSLVFGHQIFALKQDRSVVPHGHNNMATAFLVLKGEFHGRHYDRLEDDREHMIIKPTIDRPFVPGQYSTISDFRDNVHWFKATSETAFLFNIHVMGLKSGTGRADGRVYIDPNGEKLSGDRIRAKKLKTAEAFKLYG